MKTWHLRVPMPYDTWRFSAGDYIRRGNTCGTNQKCKLKKDLESHRNKNIRSWICNGFQVLTELKHTRFWRTNKSNPWCPPLSCQRFQQVWMPPHSFLNMKTNEPVSSPQNSQNMKSDSYLVLCASWKLLFPLKTRSIYQTIRKNDQIVFRYNDPEGHYAGYPEPQWFTRKHRRNSEPSGNSSLHDAVILSGTMVSTSTPKLASPRHCKTSEMKSD